MPCQNCSVPERQLRQRKKTTASAPRPTACHAHALSWPGRGAGLIWFQPVWPHFSSITQKFLRRMPRITSWGRAAETDG